LSIQNFTDVKATQKLPVFSKAIISGLGKNQLRFFVADYRREDLDGQGNYRDEQKRD